VLHLRTLRGGAVASVGRRRKTHTHTHPHPHHPANRRLLRLAAQSSSGRLTRAGLPGPARPFSRAPRLDLFCRGYCLSSPCPAHHTLGHSGHSGGMPATPLPPREREVMNCACSVAKRICRPAAGDGWAKDGDGAPGAANGCARRPGRDMPSVGCSAQCVGTHCPPCPPKKQSCFRARRWPAAAPLVASLRLMAPVRRLRCAGSSRSRRWDREGRRSGGRRGQEPSRASQTWPNKASSQPSPCSSSPARLGQTRLGSTQASERAIKQASKQKARPCCRRPRPEQIGRLFDLLLISARAAETA
jgi:hypothetical protein